MSAEAESDGAPDEEGDFEDIPDNATCKGCQYSELLPLTPEMKRQRVCRRFPPAVFAVAMVTQGQTQGFQVSATPTPVDDTTWCYEWQERDGAEIEPTGLLIGPQG